MPVFSTIYVILRPNFKIPLNRKCSSQPWKGKGLLYYEISIIMINFSPIGFTPYGGRKHEPSILIGTIGAFFYLFTVRCSVGQFVSPSIFFCIYFSSYLVETVGPLVQRAFHTLRPINVFPVPGGPWITATSLVKAIFNASYWDSSRPSSSLLGQRSSSSTGTSLNRRALRRARDSKKTR